MPLFNYVEVWPPTGRPDKLWSNRGDPDEDAFARSARNVTELYSESLAELKVAGHRSMLRISRLDSSDDPTIGVFLNLQRSVSFEMARVLLPVGVADWSPMMRALTVLDVVHLTVLRLAEARGMNSELFAIPYAHVLGHELEYRWDGPWKTSPDRRHQARARFRLMDDGYGRARLEIRRRDDDMPVASSDEAIAFSTSKGFQRSARTLRWTNSRSVQFVPYVGLWAENSHGSVRLELDGDAWAGSAQDGVRVRPPPRKTSLDAGRRTGDATAARPQVCFL